MEILHYIRNIFKPTFSMMLIISCLLMSLTAVAEEYRLDVLAQLPTLSSTPNLAVIPLPIKSDNNNQYLIADETGQLSLLKDTHLLSLARLPLSDTKKIQHVKLTALTLHPSFSLVDKVGFQTFYTAHIEPAKKNNNIARLTQLQSPTALLFDAVITQWKYDSTAPKIIDVKQRREILRIAVPTATHQIQKVAFNPYSKAWHEDYGLMHIALSDNKGESSNTSEHALYSGVVLRINPKKFGLRNYMVPRNNPFVKAIDINKEIFILGAKNIKSFSWSKLHHDALLVQHIYDGAHNVAVAKKGTDWRKTYQKKLVFPLKSNNESDTKISAYYGRELKTLVRSILYLSKSTTKWQLNKLDTTPKDAGTTEEQTETTIELLNSAELAPQNLVSLHFDHAGEPLLLDLTKKQLLSITAVKLKTTGNNNVQTENTLTEQPSEENNSVYGKLLITIFILVLSVIFYRLRPKRNTLKVKLRSQFARFELDDTKTTLSFYKRHQSKIDSQLPVADIIQSEIFLDKNNVHTINKHNGNGFNEQQENQLRRSFTQAHRHKLIDKEIRQVNLYLTDKNTNTHTVCLYMRKGNQRLTKAKYIDTLEAVIGWNWFIASQLNPKETGIRKVKETPVNKSIIKSSQKPLTHPVVAQEPEKKETTKTTQTKEELHDIAAKDPELINTLEKLINLKQQGFLTDEEFSLAKAKVLSDMTSNK